MSVFFKVGGIRTRRNLIKTFDAEVWNGSSRQVQGPPGPPWGHHSQAADPRKCAVPLCPHGWSSKLHNSFYQPVQPEYVEKVSPCQVTSNLTFIYCITLFITHKSSFCSYFSMPNPALIYLLSHFRLFPTRDITNGLLLTSIAGTALYIYKRPHLEKLSNQLRITYRYIFNHKRVK